MTTHAQLWRATSVMSAGTALSRVSGLLRVAAMTYALGVTGTRLADTYTLANTTPNIVYELFLGGILTSVFVPVLIEAKERHRGDASALISVSLVALAVISALTAVGAPLIMRIYTFRIADPTTRAAQLELASFLLRWFAPQIFFYGLSAIAQALLNVRGRFGPPSFAPVANNLVVAGVFFVYARTIAEQGLDLGGDAKLLLGLGTTAGVALQALILVPLLRGHGLRLRIVARDPAVQRVIGLATYVVAYVVTNQILLWVVLALANGATGGVAAWNIAYWFFQLPHGLAAVSLYTALLPDLSRAADAGRWDAYRSSFVTGLRGVAYLLFPAAAGYVVLAHPITRLILAHGVADARDAGAVAAVLQVFALGLPAFSTFHLLTRSFYALPDTRTPTALNGLAVALNIAIDLPLYARLGVRGLALGHAITYTCGAILLAAALSRRIPGGLGLRSVLASIVRTCAAAIVMGAAVWLVSRTVPGGDVAVVAACVLSGVLVYAVLTSVMGEGSMLSSSLRFRRSGQSSVGKGGRA